MNEAELQVGECACTRCQSACQNRPGVFLPDQITVLARALGLTEQELFEKHLQVDWWVEHPTTFMLAPRLEREKGGSLYPADPRGRCHWFVDGKCVIHVCGKPAECMQLGHKDGRNVHADRAQIVAAWRDQQELIHQLYCGELTAPPSNLFGLLARAGHRSSD